MILLTSWIQFVATLMKVVAYHDLDDTFKACAGRESVLMEVAELAKILLIKNKNGLTDNISRSVRFNNNTNVGYARSTVLSTGSHRVSGQRARIQNASTGILGTQGERTGSNLSGSFDSPTTPIARGELGRGNFQYRRQNETNWRALPIADQRRPQ